MKNNGCKKGFTLIELLVVVLIIGILAAIALPQYEKAVEKSRAAEMLTFVGNAKKAVEIYLLGNGGFPGAYVNFLKNPVLDIDLTTGLTCPEDHNMCGNKFYAYEVTCDTSSCQIDAARVENGVISQETAHMEAVIYTSDGRTWQTEAVYLDSKGQPACQAFAASFGGICHGVSAGDSSSD